MTNDKAEMPATLPGLEQESVPSGQLEASVRQQLKQLRNLGYLEDHHAGLAELAIVTARDIDRSFGRGAPSGRANLLRVMNEIFQSLPQPEAASKDALAEVVAALRDDIAHASA